MKSYFVSILAVLGGFLLTACEELNDIVPSTDNVVAGLKDALKVGTDSSVARLTKVDGYLGDEAVKLLLPPEGEQAVASYRTLVGEDLYKSTLQALHTKMITSINRSAEDAATEAAPIFVDAITGMTIDDGLQILKGDSVEATRYLKIKTFNPLTDAFSPKINTSLEKPLLAGVSTNSIWSEFKNTFNSSAGTFNDGVKLYNSIPLNFIKKDTVQTIKVASLSQYATEKALNGLFLKVQEEEVEIRKNPLNRVTDLLKQVFGRPENKYNLPQE